MKLEKMDVNLTLEHLRKGYMNSDKRKPQNRAERRLVAQAKARMNRKGNA